MNTRGSRTTGRGSRTTGRPARDKSAAAKTLEFPGPQAGAQSPDERRSRIAEAAYYRAERRGFEPGRELEDWVVAESEVDGLSRQAQGSANAIR